MGLNNSERYNTHYRDLDLINESGRPKVELKVGQVWRHKKRGTSYRIGAIGAKIQCTLYPEIEHVTGGMSWVIYFSEGSEDEKVFMRLETEFLDGRFELVTP